MQSATFSGGQTSFLMPALGEQLDPRHPLRLLAERMPWASFEEAFAGLYSGEGRPAKPVRVMVSLLLLKQMFNPGDETVVARWVENPYWQFLSGFEDFQWRLPCDPSDLVYFRQRIGEAGAQLLLAASAQLHGRAAQERTVVVDTTVQGKNITHPVDSKLHLRVIEHCRRMAQREGITLRRSYRRTVRKLRWQLRGGTSAKAIKRARRAQRRIKTIAGRLVRELGRKLAAGRHAEALEPYRRVLAQRRHDKEKIYSLHEPHVKCFGKGKAHKKYEFGKQGGAGGGCPQRHHHRRRELRGKPLRRAHLADRARPGRGKHWQTTRGRARGSRLPRAAPGRQDGDRHAAGRTVARRQGRPPATQTPERPPREHRTAHRPSQKRLPAGPQLPARSARRRDQRPAGLRGEQPAQMAALTDCIPARFASLAGLPAIPRRASLRVLKAFFRTDYSIS